MACHDPATGREILVQVLPIELDSMIRRATEPRKPAKRRQPL